jgi:hypothetical protein
MMMRYIMTAIVASFNNGDKKIPHSSLNMAKVKYP